MATVIDMAQRASDHLIPGADTELSTEPSSRQCDACGSPMAKVVIQDKVVSLVIHACPCGANRFYGGASMFKESM